MNPDLISNFRSMKITEFYRCLPNEFNQLKNNAIEIVSMFGSTYICEQFFSVLKLRKNSHSSKISDESLKHCLKVASTQNI